MDLKFEDLIKEYFPTLDYDNLPILEWDSNWIGPTEYIDNIQVDDISYPIMKGFDKYNRSYITFLLNIKKNNINNKIVFTLFQRYSDRPYPIVFGTCYYYNIHKTLLKEEEIEIYNKLIKGSIINSNNYTLSLVKY